MVRQLFMWFGNSHPANALVRALAATMLTGAVFAHARTPQQIFETAAPSIVVVEVLSAQGKLEGNGSGVVIAPGEIITNCHVAKSGKILRVKHAKSRYAARLRYVDADRDLCQLSTPGLSAPSAQLGEVKNIKTGARVVAIGAPRGLELTISEGLVSALRDFGGVKIIQTTAPISPGSSGGGLFDEAGRLIGITTFYLAEGQNLNFALPVDWIGELANRSALSDKKAAVTFSWIGQWIFLEGKKNLPEVLAHLQRWTQADPKNAIAWHLLGNAYERLGELPKAVEAYREALRIDSRNVAIWKSLGSAYSKLRQYVEAIESYRKALQLDPEDAEYWNILGIALAENGQHAQAIHAHREALRVNPQDVNAWRFVGFAYDSLGQRQSAIDAYRNALRIDPKDANLWDSLGSAYLQLKEWTPAIDAFREALRIDPRNARVWFKFGGVNSILGKRSEVTTSYQALRDLEPRLAEQLFEMAGPLISPR